VDDRLGAGNLGKNDTRDAEAAARSVLSGQATAIPKGRDGIVESIRVLRNARASAVKVWRLPTRAARVTSRTSGGDRQANSALWLIATNRMIHHPKTRDYVARRTTDGKSTKEIRRCLMRHIARGIHPLLVADLTDAQQLLLT
jgi:hypothetical protein